MTTTTLKGKQVFLYFVLFFGVIATVDAVMVTAAMKSHTGEVTDHPYEKGLAYNQVIRAEEKQEQLGWYADIQVQSGQMQVVLKDHRNMILTPDKLTAHVSRPTNAGEDFDVKLINGSAAINFPEKGQWDIRVFAVVGNANYQQSRRIVVK